MINPRFLPYRSRSSTGDNRREMGIFLVFWTSSVAHLAMQHGFRNLVMLVALILDFEFMLNIIDILFIVISLNSWTSFTGFPKYKQKFSYPVNFMLIANLLLPQIQLRICMQVMFSTFETLVSGPALRAKLAPFSPLILIAWPAHRKPTLIAGHKQVSIHCYPHLIAAYLTDLTIQVPQCLGLHQNHKTGQGAKILAKLAS